MNLERDDYPGDTPRQRRRRLLQRMDETVERNGDGWDNTKKIQLMRRLHFASVDALAASGQVVLPE